VNNTGEQERQRVRDAREREKGGVEDRYVGIYPHV